MRGRAGTAAQLLFLVGSNEIQGDRNVHMCKHVPDLSCHLWLSFFRGYEKWIKKSNDILSAVLNNALIVRIHNVVFFVIQKILKSKFS